MASPAAVRPALAIDWSARPAFDARKNVTDAGERRPDWRSRFVNHLGASDEQSNPNAGWKVNVAAELAGREEPDTL